MEVGQEDAATGSKEQNQRAKGKRTKRQRLQFSPIHLSLITSNSNLSEAADHGELFGQLHNIINCETFFSSTSSNVDTDDDHDGDQQQEDEDMANCLILLAQGQPWNSPKQAGSELSSSFKFNSRRFVEAADNGTGKGGCFVYECKTCGRTFPSFQALGGHRASCSHKKPLKVAMAANEKKLVSELSPDIDEEDEEHEEQEGFKNNILSPLEFRLRRSDSCNKLGYKVHECSFCGVEFTSGQALGGHMRRHRRGLGTNSRVPSLASMAPMEEAEERRPKKQRRLMSLDLDLNLPAQEDDYREQPAIVLTAPALVGCHY